MTSCNHIFKTIKYKCADILEYKFFCFTRTCCIHCGMAIEYDKLHLDTTDPRIEEYHDASDIHYMPVHKLYEILPWKVT